MGLSGITWVSCAEDVSQPVLHTADTGSAWKPSDPSPALHASDKWCTGGGGHVPPVSEGDSLPSLLGSKHKGQRLSLHPETASSSEGRSFRISGGETVSMNIHPLLSAECSV